LGPGIGEKIKSGGDCKKRSFREKRIVLLNGINVKKLPAVTLKNGDKSDVLPRVAGG